MADTPSRGQIAMVLLLGTLWGLNWPTAKIALAEIGPWTLRAVALWVGVVALTGLGLARRHRFRLPPRQWWRVLLPGTVGIAAPNVLVAHAQLSAATGRVAIVAFTMPIWTALLARLCLGEPLTRRRLVAVGLGLTGLAVLTLPLWGSGEMSRGLAFGLLAALCWSVFPILVKLFPADCTPLVFAAWQLAVAAPTVAAGMLIFEGVPDRLPTGATLIAIGYNAVLGQALATALWFEILARIPAGTAALSMLIVPAIGMGTAALFLGEHPTVTDLIGLVLTMTAAGAVLLPERRPPYARAVRG